MIETILWILVGVLALAAAAYGVAAWWVSRAGVHYKALMVNLRELKAAIERERGAVAAYTAADPEPFGLLAKQHAQKTAEVETSLRSLLSRYGDAQNRHRAASAFQFPEVLRLPVDALKLRAEIEAMNRKAADAREALGRAEMITDQLNKMGWTVAEQVRQALEDIRSAQSTLAGVVQEGILDPNVDAVIERGKRWEQSFRSQAPVVVLSGTQEEVLGEANKALIAKIHGLVSSARPDIDEIGGRANEWKTKLTALRKSLAELPERYRAAVTSTTQMETAEMHPVQWDVSREPLAAARQTIERIGDAQRRRNLNELDSDQTEADDLISELKVIEAQVAGVCEKHKEFVDLLSAPDVNTGVEWLRSMVRLAEQVDEYDPANWARELRVETLRQDFEAIARLHRALAFDKPDHPVLESALDGLLEHAGKLAGLHEGVRPRAAAIEARLKVIQAGEKQAQEDLSRAKALLNQAASVVASCPSLGTQAVDEAEQLRAGVDPIAEALNHPEDGTVDEKAGAAEALLRKADLTMNRWTDKVTADLETRKNTLAAKVAQLREISELDDPAIQEAARFVREAGAKPAAAAEKTGQGNGSKRILSRLPVFGKGGRAGGDGERVSLGLSGGIQQIKTMNEELQSCLIALRKVEEVEEPVLKAYAEAEEAREDALQLAARGSELVPEGRAWPPTGLTLVNERGQLAGLEERWKKLKESPLRAIQLVSALTSLAGEYRMVAANLRGLIDRIQHDQGRFVELEGRLEEAAREWERMARSSAEDAAAQEEIHTLVDGSRQEYAGLRERYLRGAVSYNQALQTMRMIVQRVEGGQIELGDGSMIELPER